MRVAILTCCVLALAFLALAGLSYMTGMSLKVAVTDIDNGVVIQNKGNTRCLVFISSPEGVQQFQLAVDENVTVTGVVQTVDVAATSDLTISLEDWERMMRAHEKLGRIKLGLSSNLTDP
jgi:hypothetical protein